MKRNPLARVSLVIRGGTLTSPASRSPWWEARPSMLRSTTSKAGHTRFATAGDKDSETKSRTDRNKVN